jgi:hypothetical protein
MARDRINRHNERSAGSRRGRCIAKNCSTSGLNYATIRGSCFTVDTLLLVSQAGCISGKVRTGKWPYDSHSRQSACCR